MLGHVTEDARRSIEAGDPRLRCPVCDAPELTRPPYAEYTGVVPADAKPPYEDLFGMASYEVCPSCGFEFGNDDNPGGSAQPSSFEDYRQEWQSRGAPRFWPPADG
jgi:hypothetical protein